MIRYKLAIDRHMKELEKQLCGKEQNLFFDQMRVDVAAEEEITAISQAGKYEIKVRRQFIVKVEGFR